MPISEHLADRADVSYSAQQRADGSYRQACIMAGDQCVAFGYFKPGTIIDLRAMEIIEGEHSYHWACAFTDEELMADYEGFGFTREEVDILRAEAEIANHEKTYFHKELHQ